MARHNRVGRGTDQRGADYAISYQPDWLQQVKVTRVLENGRQSTKTLFRNPEKSGRGSAAKARTRISSRKEGLDFEIGVNDPHGVITRIVVETSKPDRSGDSTIQFSIDDGQTAKRRRRAKSGSKG
jgi:hypothetical protein